jgi:hypothetical protein
MDHHVTNNVDSFINVHNEDESVETRSETRYHTVSAYDLTQSCSSVSQHMDINMSTCDETVDSIEKSLTSKKNNYASINSVPTITNVDDIFNLLSKKIAKYCQVLADLTNCEVFYKAQLPAKEPFNDKAAAVAKNSKKYSIENDANRARSLYWGTHQMLFEHSHTNGIRLDKSGLDCLIRINQRLLSTDMNDLIEEVLNGPAIQGSSASWTPDAASNLKKMQ